MVIGLRLPLLLALAVLSLSLFTGCSTIQQQLQPVICDCEVADTCAPTPRDIEIATAIAVYQVEAAHPQAMALHHPSDVDLDEALASADDSDVADAADANEVDTADPILEEQADEAPQVETAVRQAAAQQAPAPQAQPRATRPAPQQATGDVANPAVTSAMIPLSTERERATFATAYGFNPPAGALAFQGGFNATGDHTIAMYLPGQSLRFYRDGSLIAQHRFEDHAPVDADLGVEPTAVNLTGGDAQQLQLVHAVPNDDGITYYLGIYKVIGQFVGTTFYKPIARQAADGQVQRIADFRFLEGEDHRVIEWTDLDGDGQPIGEPTLYEWNRWEGVFRVPGPPPTAPVREAPVS